MDYRNNNSHGKTTCFFYIHLWQADNITEAVAVAVTT